MKQVFKGLLVLSMATTALVAKVSDEEILKQFNAYTQNGIKVELKNRSKLPGTPFEKVLVKMTKDGIPDSYKGILLLDDYIIASAADAKSQISLSSMIEDEALLENNLYGLYALYDKLINNADQKSIEHTDNKDFKKAMTEFLKAKKIKLGNDKNKKTLVYFTDPVCPFCRASLANIENYLSRYNLLVIHTPITSHWTIGGLEKTQAIENEISANPKMSDKEKIAILRKYYDEKAPIPTIDESKFPYLTQQKTFIQDIINTKVLPGVPSSFDLDLLKKGYDTFKSKPSKDVAKK